MSGQNEGSPSPPRHLLQRGARGSNTITRVHGHGHHSWPPWPWHSLSPRDHPTFPPPDPSSDRGKGLKFSLSFEPSLLRGPEGRRPAPPVSPESGASRVQGKLTPPPPRLASPPPSCPPVSLPHKTRTPSSTELWPGSTALFSARLHLWPLLLVYGVQCD